MAGRRCSVPRCRDLLGANQWDDRNRCSLSLGNKSFRVRYHAAGQSCHSPIHGRSFGVRWCVVCAGRCSNTQLLNVAAAGLTLGARGLIQVGPNFQSIHAEHILLQAMSLVRRLGSHRNRTSAGSRASCVRSIDYRQSRYAFADRNLYDS